MRSVTAILVGFLLLSTAAAASVPEDPDVPSEGADPRQLIGFRTFTITELHEGRTVVLRDELDDQRHVLKLSPELKIRAQSKKDFDGRRKLDFEDLDVGQRLKVSFRKSDGEIVRLDVLHDERR